MTAKTLRIIAAIAIGLILLLFVLQGVDDDGRRDTGGKLLPDFAAVANEAREIRIVGPDDPDGVTLRRDDERWVVVERDGYAADLGKLRQLVIALAEASIVEEKTSNPEYYERLGLVAPGDDGSGLLVTVSGDDFTSNVILGETAQGDYRYARNPEQPASYLIDRNPEAPASPGDWLDPVIVDVAASDVRLVTVEHADGERVELAKPDDNPDDNPDDKEGEDGEDVEPAAAPRNFIAVNLPEGRELTYPAVGDSIAGALAGLELDDVRPATDGEPSGHATFVTGAGLAVDVQVIEETVAAEPDDEEPGDDETSDADDEDASEAAEETETWLRFSASAGAGSDAEAAAAAETVNERVSGWEYRVPDYKVQLLTKRWDDLLKAPPP